MEKKTLAIALQDALSMEEKGHKFYMEAAQRGQNDVARKTFDFLARNELFHIESIKKFSNAINEKSELPSVLPDDTEIARSEEFKIFSTGISELNEKIKPNDDDKQALEFAMDFENSGYKYYENMLKDAQEKNLKELLKFLLSEESKHHELLMNLYSYVTDSQNWFMYEEGSFPQG
ncbi:MAG: ferritin family protein [Candidatus Omnitrophota bacterium]